MTAFGSKNMPTTIKYKKYLVAPVSVTWFNTSLAPDFDRGSWFHIFRQSVALTNLPHQRCLRAEKFVTSILDLRRPEEELWRDLAAKSCRYEIRKVQKMCEAGEQVRLSEDTDLEEFLILANNYIQAKGYSQLLKRTDFSRYVSQGCGELITVLYHNQLLGGNFYVTDHPARVRLLYSFNRRLEEEAVATITGPCMRYLHWQTMVRRYKPAGYTYYDMGGVDLNRQSQAYGITQFKRSFGGELREEWNYVMACCSVLARGYELTQRIRSGRKT